MRIQTLAILLVALAAGCSGPAPEAPRSPNIVLVITDDQGYGDVGAHGNSMIRTPNLDTLHAGSIRLTDYHVDPTCAPTRSALMTGRYSSRTGVWHTIMGRSLVAADETMLPELLADAGYATGHFGKWHSGRQLPLPARGSRLSRGRTARRRRRAADARLLGQRLLRRHLLAQRRAASVRGLLHRRVLPRGDALHRRDGLVGSRQAVLRVHSDKRATRALLRRRRILEALRRAGRARADGALLRDDREHR